MCPLQPKAATWSRAVTSTGNAVQRPTLGPDRRCRLKLHEFLQSTPEMVFCGARRVDRMGSRRLSRFSIASVLLDKIDVYWKSRLSIRHARCDARRHSIATVMSRSQLNVRVSEELERAIDEKRIELRGSLGTIPSRSEVLRLALETYLKMKLRESDEDGRRKVGPAKRSRRKP
jgi:Arc/MetJ-type ribon-helix-helix transcriptional regulator